MAQPTTTDTGPSAASAAGIPLKSRKSRFGLEDAAVVLSCALATLYLEWSIIFHRGVYQTVALIHEVWM